MNCHMKKIFYHTPLVLGILFLLQSPLRPEETAVPGEGVKNFSRDGDAGKKRDAGVENIEIHRTAGISMTATLALDVALPGGGHFYRGDYLNGFIFFSLKAAGAYSVYYFTGRKETALSDYRSARRSGGVEGSPEKERLRYDRAAQLVTFSFIGNLMIYFISASINYNRVMKMNENSYPSFDIYSSMSGGWRNDSIISVQYNFRM